MKIPATNSSCSFRETGSKFIGYLFATDDQKAFGRELDQIKSEYPDATHHCYAWRLNPADIEEFAQDDGEPGGTAGLPILNQLKSFEVVNAGIVVVRYYGGTNLGKSGLIQAYGKAAEWCLQKTRLQSIRHIWKVEVDYPYSEQSIIETLKHRFSLEELDAAYAERVTLTLACPVHMKNELEQQLDQLQHRGIGHSIIAKSFL